MYLEQYLEQYVFRTVMYLLDIKSYIHPGAECNCPVAIYTHLVAMTILYRWNGFTTV